MAASTTPSTDVGDKLALSVNDVCAALGVSRPTVYELIRNGRLRTVTLGRRRVIPRTELDRLLAPSS